MSDFYNQFWNTQKEEEMFDFSYKWPVIKGLIPSRKNMVILDFGCGPGMVMDEMKKINPKSKYIGIDISRTAINMAKKRHPKTNFHIVKDGARFPLRDKSVDFILAADVIEHAFYTQELFSELSRVLKPRGKILISTPFHGLIKNLVISLIGFEKVFDPTEAHIRFFTTKSLFPMLEEAGLKVKKHGHYGRFYPLSRGLYVVAQK